MVPKSIQFYTNTRSSISTIIFSTALFILGRYKALYKVRYSINLHTRNSSMDQIPRSFIPPIVSDQLPTCPNKNNLKWPLSWNTHLLISVKNCSFPDFSYLLSQNETVTASTNNLRRQNMSHQ